MTNIYNNNSPITQNQDIYDSFNHFIMSKDRNVFNKLYSRIKFYEMTKHLAGDIVECGVFKGSGLISWLKILKMSEPHSIKKVIGFDFFNPQFVQALENKVDREMMQQVFDRCEARSEDGVSVEAITSRVLNAGFNLEDFDLVAGDICVTSKSYLADKPGMRISILYLDMDLAKPTYEALENMWDRVSFGGIVVFDEYGYHKWSESDGVDQFVRERGLKLHTTSVKAPTAYLVK